MVDALSAYPPYIYYEQLLVLSQHSAVVSVRFQENNMSAALHLGPLVVPGELVIQILAVVAGMLLATYLGLKSARELEPIAWRILLIGFVSSRLIFVLRYHEAYFASPLTIFDFRDGGWNAPFGYFAAWVYGVWIMRSRPILRRALLSGLGIATFIWMAGTLLTSLPDSEVVRLKSEPVARVDGKQIALNEFQGKPTVVNLWATWCPPCRREMPAFEQAQNAHPEVNFVFLNQGESASLVQEFLEANKLKLHHVLLDSKGQVGGQFSRGMLPTTIFFDAKGRLVDIRLGELSYPSLLQRLEMIEAISASPSE